MEQPGSICVGDIEIHPREHLVLVRGQHVPLTAREFDIVVMLAEHPGWTYSANQLSDDPVDGDYSPDSVSVLISRLRQKLSRAGATDLVETVRGVGYRLLPAGACAVEPEAPHESRELRDAAWQLQEAVIEAEHLGTEEQQRAVAETLEQARRAVYSALAE